MILVGPLEPKLNAEAFVASEKVGDGGLGDVCRREPKDKARRERELLRGIAESEGKRQKVQLQYVRYCWCHLVAFSVTLRTTPPLQHSSTQALFPAASMLILSGDVRR
jgi:hypothetical protein